MLNPDIRKFLLLMCLVLFPKLNTYAAETYTTPSNSSFKSYMDYRAITDTNSKQYKLQKVSETDAQGLRTYNDRYIIAVGPGFNASVCDYIDVELSTGVVLNCVVGDLKQKSHIGADGIQVGSNGNIIEFVVDTNSMSKGVKTAGDISVLKGFDGDVKSVTVHDKEADLTKPVKEKESKEEYFIVAKSKIEMPNNQALYSIEYAHEGSLNNILCSKNYYDSVEIGDIVNKLE